MTFPMLDHLRILNEVFTGGIFVLSLGVLFACFRFMSFLRWWSFGWVV